jgi:hypothetical protein
MDAAPRLTSAMRVAALLRLARAADGFPAVLARGDETAGAILVVMREKGRNPVAFERLMSSDGCYRWGRISPDDMTQEIDFNSFIQRRRQRDPDLWLIELDVADATRFVDEILSSI